MIFPENLEVRRAVFERMGCKWKSVFKPHRNISQVDSFCWVLDGEEISIRINDEEPRPSLLPSIEITWSETVRLIEWMRERGWDYEISGEGMKFWWIFDADLDEGEVIKNDNLPLAACEAFLQIPDKEVVK